MTAKTLMVLGSMSSAGKSMLVTGLCRLYQRRGWRVAPFKAQNMSNNAAVCAGGEIGRAQAVQAYAAGIEPTVDMNPILLKPEADSSSQVVVRGQVWESLSAREYYTHKDQLWQVVTESLDRLKEQSELVILEGAGSPAELNLLAGDIVNLAAARYAQAPCLLVGDIDCGGVYAQLLGTLSLLEKGDRSMVRSLVVNKFRGDISLFTDGIRILEERGGVPVLGVIPYLYNHGISEEDAAVIGKNIKIKPGAAEIAVIHLPHISNFDDADPLALEPGGQLRYVQHAGQLGHPAAIILPGTKNTLADLLWLQQNGLAEKIQDLAAQGVAVVGLCGGFQMLGEEVVDSLGIESGLSRCSGLGLLPGKTYFESQKTITRSQATIVAKSGFLNSICGQNVEGYEIHMGQTSCPQPFSQIKVREHQPVSVLDGGCSQNGQVWGTYLHGILDNDALRIQWLKSLGISPSLEPFKQRRSQAYDSLADVLETSLDISKLDQIIENGLKTLSY